MEINTPGGDLESTKEIVQAESNAENTPVLTYVTPRGADAASAGSVIVMGSDVAAMAPQSSIGATTPVSGSGRDLTGDLGQKVLNNTVSLITGLAAAHDRNEKWAEAAVREAASANAAEALDMNIVEYVEPDLRALLEAADGKTVKPKDITLDTANATLVQKPLNFKERFGFSMWWVIVPAIPAGAVPYRVGVCNLQGEPGTGQYGPGRHGRGGRDRSSSGRQKWRPGLRPRRTVERHPRRQERPCHREGRRGRDSRLSPHIYYRPAGRVEANG